MEINQGFGLPPELQAELEKLQRRQKLAEAMSGSAREAINRPTEQIGGYAVRQPPLGTIAQALSGYMAHRRGEKAGEEMGGLRKQAADVTSQEIAGLNGDFAKGLQSQNPQVQKYAQLASLLAGQKATQDHTVAQTEELRRPKPASLLKLNPGEVAFDPVSGERKFEGNPQAEKQSALAALLAERAQLPPGSPQAALYDAQIRKMTTHAPGTQVNVNNPKMVYDDKRGIMINPYDAKGQEVTVGGKPVGSADSAKEREGAAQRYGQIGAGIAQARKLLATATSSGLGAVRDTALNVAGQSTPAADAAAELETIAGWMTSNVPRMQGPQSDKDTLLYRQMAAQVGDRTKPTSQRLAALNALEELQKRYAEVNGVTVVAAPPGAPKRTRYDAQGNPLP